MKKALLALAMLSCLTSASAADVEADTVVNALHDVDAQYIGTGVAVGDSITERMLWTQVAPDIVNFGIGGATARTLFEHMRGYHWTSTAAYVILAVGTNSVKDTTLTPRFIALQIEKCMDLVTVPLIVSGIHHVIGSDDATVARNLRADRTNDEVQSYCAARAQCTFVPSPLGDDPTLIRFVHLHPAGDAAWAAATKAAVASFGFDVAP